MYSYVNEYICIRKHINIHKYVYVYIHIHICIYIYTYICICIYIHTCTYIYIHMYIYTHIYIYTYIDIYTHTQMSHDSIIQVMPHEPITRSQAIAHTTPANSKPDTNMISNVNSTPAPIICTCGGEGGGGEGGMRQNIKSKYICTHMTNILGRNICTLKCSKYAHAHVYAQKHTRTRVCVTKVWAGGKGAANVQHFDTTDQIYTCVCALVYFSSPPSPSASVCVIYICARKHTHTQRAASTTSIHV